jgi:hypothetical protein
LCKRGDPCFSGFLDGQDFLALELDLLDNVRGLITGSPPLLPSRFMMMSCKAKQKHRAPLLRARSVASSERLVRAKTTLRVHGNIVRKLYYYLMLCVALVLLLVLGSLTHWISKYEFVNKSRIK